MCLGGNPRWEATPACMELSRRKLEALRRGSCPFLSRATRCAPACGSSHGDTGQFQTEDWINRLVLTPENMWLAKVSARKGDEGVIAHSPLIQEIPVKFSWADLIIAIPSKTRQQFQYLLTKSKPNFFISLASAEMWWLQNGADGKQWPFYTHTQKSCDSQNRSENG